MPDLESLLDRLQGSGFEFVVVGGFAAMAHGSTLMTQDLDVCCAFEPENLARLANALRGIRPAHRMTPSRRAVDLDGLPTAGLKNLYLETSLGQLDCLSEMSTLGTYAVVSGLADTITIRGGTCRILGIDALIRSKEALGRPRDLSAAIELRAIRERRAGPDSPL